MSATLGVMLKELDPALATLMVEALGDCAQESWDSWNNAGSGHAANCELTRTAAGAQKDRRSDRRSKIMAAKKSSRRRLKVCLDDTDFGPLQQIGTLHKVRHDGVRFAYTKHGSTYWQR